MVVETPPLSLGVIDDMWFRWVTDFGLPGPDRGEGGRYLLVPPDYKGEVPESGYFAQTMRTTRATSSGGVSSRTTTPSRRSRRSRRRSRSIPTCPGGYGRSIGLLWRARVRLGRTRDHKLDWAFLRPQEPVKFTEGTGKVMNTVPPNDFSYFEMINDVVQKEPVARSTRRSWVARRHRHREGQAVQSGCADEADPDRCGGHRNRRGPNPQLELAPVRGRSTIPTRPGRTCSSPAATTSKLRRQRSALTERSPPTRPPATGAQRAHDDFFTPPHHPGDDHATDGHRFAVSRRVRRLQWRVFRRRQDLQDDPPAQRPGEEVLVLDRLRQPDSLDARHAAALPARRQPELPNAGRRTERRRLYDRVFRPQPAEGSRGNWIQTCPARAGTRSCVSTARWNRSSRSSGGRARSNWSPDSPDPVRTRVYPGRHR